MGDAITYRQMLAESEPGTNWKRKSHTAKHKALEKGLSGRSQKQQMNFTKQNRDYQNKFHRAWND